MVVGLVSEVEKVSGVPAKLIDGQPDLTGTRWSAAATAAAAAAAAAPAQAPAPAPAAETTPAAPAAAPDGG
jgi:hypothetical protein